MNVDNIHQFYESFVSMFTILKDRNPFWKFPVDGFPLGNSELGLKKNKAIVYSIVWRKTLDKLTVRFNFPFPFLFRRKESGTDKLTGRINNHHEMSQQFFITQYDHLLFSYSILSNILDTLSIVQI